MDKSLSNSKQKVETKQVDLDTVGLLAAAYLIPVSQMAFFVKDPQEKFRSYGEISYAMLIPICITTLIALILGCVPNIYPHFYELATMASNAVCAGWHGGWLY